MLSFPAAALVAAAVIAVAVVAYDVIAVVAVAFDAIAVAADPHIPPLAVWSNELTGQGACRA
jgi:hypothetical protein